MAVEAEKQTRLRDTLNCDTKRRSLIAVSEHCAIVDKNSVDLCRTDNIYDDVISTLLSIRQKAKYDAKYDRPSGIAFTQNSQKLTGMHVQLIMKIVHEIQKRSAKKLKVQKIKIK